MPLKSEPPDSALHMSPAKAGDCPGAAATHIAMAVSALWERRSLRMSWIEAVRLVLGLSLPLLLASHLTAMRWAHEAYGLDGSYLRVAGGLWGTPGAVFQLTMMSAACGQTRAGVVRAMNSPRRTELWRGEAGSFRVPTSA